ncbi:unnamed protein product [Penicillium salamii]|uniref:C2H2-type domain-containing protein n=1 Tax=Penicillium salamii TaxID=1612424 RepID=A0A9W4NVZ7_9EURO|nr:unnamed protein product [Penicillium salamii]CAG8191368.1 unnamed protein product [Penicillium salamii]CAG8249532.1 unnamed protein product [Penicillium salamii]CAG8278822.1 unnamed protein product [Penicillium salamii]CAG8310366.1 unnamed protein product [Penicillium salamii]
MECKRCGRAFASLKACQQHMNTLGHNPVYECETCDRVFGSLEGVNRHMQVKEHWSNYCQSCHRRFETEQNYNAHMKSATHRGYDLVCQYCCAEFVTPSGVLHHLESCSCPKRPDRSRNRFYRDIQRLDTDGEITFGRLESESEWECMICSQEFNCADAVASHILHSHEGLYHCPNERDYCNKGFVSLAALFNHLESESCHYTSFEDVETYLVILMRSVHNSVEIYFSLD